MPNNRKEHYAGSATRPQRGSCVTIDVCSHRDNDHCDNEETNRLHKGSRNLCQNVKLAIMERGDARNVMAKVGLAKDG